MVLNNPERDNLTFQNEIVSKCCEKWPEKAAQVKKTAQTLLPLSAGFENREKDPQVLNDILFSFFALGFSPDEYVYYRLEGRTVEEKLTFLSDRKRIQYHSYLDNLIESSVFTDKYLTYLKFQPYFSREIIEIKTTNDYSRFAAFVERHPQYVKKDVYSSCGRSVEMVDSVGCGKTVKQQFDEIIAAGMKHVAEELIVQSKEMAQFHTASVNTVRCITMNTRDGVQIPFGFFRVGSSGSFVDNAGSGGYSSAIDMNAGKVITDGYNEKGFHAEVHPNSGVVFKGFRFPDWNELLATAKKVASELPGVKTIGWDFAHTDKGWVMVEGNAMSQIGVLQIPMQRGMRAEFERYFREMEPIINPF